ncbi:zinc finger BED domain-containing protein RICESLEEPER 3-like [Cucumis melo var. makuwa]|uniref:Zinc finger BED domain-containing protein RICESLEEPER 3-like n=1 Tax=Cucumis melo var. makuwa TaxID=1194695 RepID=A0A5A7SHY6_CUCMM|nr:zinc finger BED domain-containing protein RICESLEEPER 3-like [Cucumis melo var. makuwa]
MDSMDMELECDGSCEASKIVRDEDTNDKRKTIDVDLDSYGREDVPNPPKIRKNVKQSMVWDHFERLKGDPNDPRAKCKYCGVVYECHSKRNGTGTMKHHLENCKKYPYQKKRDQTQMTLAFKPKDKVGDNSSQLVCESFSLDGCRDALVEMIIVDELPFKFVEGKGFKKFVDKLTCGNHTRFVVPSRFTVARDVLKLYVNEKNRLRDMFVKNKYRVSLTTDCWTSGQNINYMVLTALFIDFDWKLHKRILSFSPIENHKGDTIGKTIEKNLKDWGIERVMTLTIDNASSNDTAVAYLLKRFNKGLLFGREFLHVRCCAHILNLIVTDAFKEHNDCIDRIRYAVRFIRWNSTYMMLEDAVKFEKAFDRLEDEDASYRHDMSPNKEDWTNARIFVYDTIVEEFEDDSTTPFDQGSSEIDIYLLEANVRTEVSTVASESAFSTGGCVVDSSRCSLAPKTVEALICTQNWLNFDPIHLQFQHELEEASKFEEGFRVVMENEKELEDLPDFDKLSITNY